MNTDTFDIALTAKTGDHSVLIRHSSMSGITRTNLTKFKIVGVNQQPPISVVIDLQEGAKRHRLEVFSDDAFAYYTIESRNGATVYDSRTHVPCDMHIFEKRKRAFREQAAQRPWLKPVPEWDVDIELPTAGA